MRTGLSSTQWAALGMQLMKLITESHQQGLVVEPASTTCINTKSDGN